MIKNCPFCGNEPDQPGRLYSPVNPQYAIYCCTCEFSGPVGNSPRLAIEAWNTRYYPDPYRKEIDNLKRELENLKIKGGTQ